MQIQIQPWTIQEVIDNIGDFILSPKYQRLPVWKGQRKSLLIDSILRGYDLPKFYIKINPGPPRTWEVTDGQQRINTIMAFYNDEFSIEPSTEINGVELSRLRFSGLPSEFKNLFLQFTLTFSEIISSAQGEVNDLFARLQKGVPLNPVELRHAMFSNFGFAVDDLLEDQHVRSFLSASRIPIGRYKHQDYIDHVLAVSILGDTRDLKADAMASLYKDYATTDISSLNRYFRNTKRILRKMQEMNVIEPGLFKNKWSFVDAFTLLLGKVNNLQTIDSASFATLFNEFNSMRIDNRQQPEVALRSRTLQYGRELYSYILAFEKEAATRESLRRRNTALETVFEDILGE